MQHDKASLFGFMTIFLVHVLYIVFYYLMLNVKKVVLERNTSSLLLADFKSLDFTLLRKVELL